MNSLTRPGAIPFKNGLPIGHSRKGRISLILQPIKNEQYMYCMYVCMYRLSKRKLWVVGGLAMAGGIVDCLSTSGGWFGTIIISARPKALLHFLHTNPILILLTKYMLYRPSKWASFAFTRFFCQVCIVYGQGPFVRQSVE